MQFTVQHVSPFKVWLTEMHPVHLTLYKTHSVSGYVVEGQMELANSPSSTYSL
jgi:hypothetical protein